MLPNIITTLMLLTNGVIQPQAMPVQNTVLASKSLDLNDRYGNQFVNDVFKYNILLTMSNMGYEFELKPGEEFAFHDQVLSDRSANIVKTTNSHFGYDQGYHSDGYLMGDGVCHLASLIYWAAKQAELDAYAPTNHDFAVIPDVPREYGVAIYTNPVDHTGQMTNLYITNNKSKPVKFVFENKNDQLNLNIIQEN